MTPEERAGYAELHSFEVQWPEQARELERLRQVLREIEALDHVKRDGTEATSYPFLLGIAIGKAKFSKYRLSAVEYDMRSEAIREEESLARDRDGAQGLHGQTGEPR